MNFKKLFSIGFALSNLGFSGSANATQGISPVPNDRVAGLIAQCANTHIGANNYSKGMTWRTCGYTLAFQGDGNLVMYNSGGLPIWATGTEGYAQRLAVQGDGNMVLYDGSNRAIWATNTDGRGRIFALQADGNFVVYDSNGRAVYSTGTHGGQARTFRAAYDWGWRPVVVNNPTPQVNQVNFGANEYRGNNIFWNGGYAPVSTSPRFSYLGSALGNCTWYANGRGQQMGWSKAKLDRMGGNASQWGGQAAAAGIRTSSSPQVGAIAQWNVSGSMPYGHVAVVERVNNDGTVLISESSYGSGAWNFLYRQRTIAANNPSRYILP
jgi:surface antigen